MKKTLLLLLGVWITSIFSLQATRLTVTNTATLTSQYTACADGDTLMLATATYSSNTLSITKSVTLKASPGASPILYRPVITMSTTGKSFACDSIESYYDADGVSPATDSKYFITAISAITIPSITIKNCKIHGWGRGVIRSDNSSNFCTINTITINNCLFYEIGGGSPDYPVFGVKTAKVTTATITNSTFYNSMCAVWRSTETTTPITFRMENCTLLKLTNNSALGVGAKNSTGLIAAAAKASGTSTYTIRNCVISDSYDGTSTQMTINVGTGATVTASLENVLLGNNMGTITGTYSPDTRVTLTGLTYNYSQKTIATTPNTYYNNGDPRWTLNPVNAGITSVSAPSPTLCAATTQTLTATGVVGTNAVVTWWTAAGGTGSNLGTGLTLANAGIGTFYARVTASYGSPAEAFVTVTESEPLSIAVQPQSVNGSYYQLETPNDLTITASGSGLSYQWYKSTDNSNSSIGDDVAIGTNSNTYTPSTVDAGTLYYYCLLSGTCSTLKSNVAKVEVSASDMPSMRLFSGSATQNVDAGTPISSIVYSWGGSAIDPQLTWSGSSVVAPTGISVDVNAETKQVTISGTPAVAGTYNLSIQSTDDTNLSSPSTGSIVAKLVVPTAQAPSDATNQGFTAHWTDVAGESSYTLKVYQGASLVSTISSIAANSTSDVVTGLNPNTTYTYTVTAIGDGSLVASSNASAASTSIRTLSTTKAITAFTIAGQISSSVNEGAKTILILVPVSADKSNLTPSTITCSQYANVDPANGVPQNFTSPVAYTVTAEDLTQQVYTVTVQTGSLATDYFKSKASGSWTNATPGNVWESSADNSNWYTATLTPGSSAADITILDTHAITITSAITANNIVVNAGGKLSVNSGGTLTLNASKTLTINGTLENGVYATANPFTLGSGATIVVNNGGLFDLTAAPTGSATTDATFIPTATWNTGSTCKVSGIVGTLETDYTVLNGVNQAFDKFEINTPNLIGKLGLQNVAAFGSANTFTVNSTGPGTGASTKTGLQTSNATTSPNRTGTTVTNYVQNAGVVHIVSNSSSAIGRSFTATGNFTLNGGTFNIAEYTTAGATTPLTIGGNLTVASGAILQKDLTTSGSGDFGTVQLILNGNTVLSNTGTIRDMDAIIVNGGKTLDFGTSVIGSIASGNNANTTFTTGAESVLKSAAAGGINANITSGGTTTLNSTTNYVFNRAGTQVSGSLVTSADSITVANGSNLTLSANTSASTLIVNAGAAAYVSASKQLTISTTLSNSGSLSLLSDASGTGTLLAPASLSGTGGTYNVQQYLTGTTNSGTGLPNGRFWYISSPVTGATSAVLAPSTGNKFWSWLEASNGYSAITTDDVPLTSGIGYVARMKDNGVVQFAGTIRTGDVNIDIARTGSSNYYRGFNLIGNPYPSFATLTVADNAAIEPSIWYRTLTLDLSAMAFDTYNYEGASYVSGSGNGPVTGFIPPMQAFWVKTHIVGTSTVAFKQANRSHQASVKLRSAEADTVPCIRLQISNGKAKDQTLIGLYKLASDEFDKYDSHKMKNGIDSFPEIFTMNGNEELAINGLKHDGRSKTLALGFRTGKKGDFKLKVLELKNLGDSVKVILKDKIKNCDKELKDSTEYDFTSDVATTTDRFTIVIMANAPTSLKDADMASADAYSTSDHQIQIRLIGTSDNYAKVAVYSILGQQVGAFTTNSANTVLGKRFAPGIYLVNVAAQGVQVTKKVVINQ
jgi:hypothetical protein